MWSQPRRGWPLGFTVVELMIVVLMIGLLLAIAIPAFQQAQQHARRLECMNNLRQIHTALASYANANSGLLPTNEPGGEEKYPWPPAREAPGPLLEDVSTNLIGWRGNTLAARQQGKVPWGLGKLHAELSEDLSVLFCPTDRFRDAAALRQVFRNDGTLSSGATPDCSYLYRGRDAPDKVDTTAIRLFRAGSDSVRALVMDYCVEWWGCPNPAHGSVREIRPGKCPVPGCGKTLIEFRAWPRRHGDRVCVLFEDGSVMDVPILAPDHVTLRLVDPRSGPDALNRVWRTADVLYESDD